VHVALDDRVGCTQEGCGKWKDGTPPEDALTPAKKEDPDKEETHAVGLSDKQREAEREEERLAQVGDRGGKHQDAGEPSEGMHGAA
jgi:hypothetical protein